VLRFATPQNELSVGADAVALALGGGSWARLGANAACMPLLPERWHGSTQTIDCAARILHDGRRFPIDLRLASRDNRG
jgi:predicted flavoprotein YhiN